LNLKVCDNKEEIGRCAATIFASQVLRKEDSVLGLATGSSVLTTYAEMVKDYQAGITDYDFITTFNLDEYCGLSPTHEQSYSFFMKENLFSEINIRSENINFPDNENLYYDSRIKKAGGIDLQLLGIGHNGHIAFNEPCEHFPYNTHTVALSDSTISANSRFFKSADEVPKKAVTMGIGTIMKAKSIVLLAYGKEKADAVNKMVNGKITPSCPASILQLHNNVTVMIDTEIFNELH